MIDFVKQRIHTIIELKKQAKAGVTKQTKQEEDQTIPIDQVITLDHLTNPDKK